LEGKGEKIFSEEVRLLIKGKVGERRGGESPKLPRIIAKGMGGPGEGPVFPESSPAICPSLTSEDEAGPIGQKDYLEE